MKTAAIRCGTVVLWLAAAAVAQAQPPAAPLPRLGKAECEVWARELSFAQSVADRDAVAFAAHLEPEAAFGAGQAEPTRGREDIARRWAGIIEGKRVKVAWYPTRTTVAGVGNIAWSSGPSLFEDPDPHAEHRYRIGAFNSVWHRGDDGVWRVLFDDGIEPRPVSEAEAVAFREARRTACPQG
jgi:ketosteroid isomerase-like protein